MPNLSLVGVFISLRSFTDSIVARLKGSIEHISQYLPSTILGLLNEQYE